MIDSMTRPVPQPWAGIIDDLEREDDDLGFEPDETEERLWVRIPSVSGDTTVGVHRLAPHSSGLQQCDVCGGWFGVTFWTCPACQVLGQLPVAERMVR
ncbi:hypothetical protein AB0942_29005 [Streptomyces nodosus]|uniref:hypothetical protein n=1 Tax=Streptomyces nodosus TaxID=40318 RepID=UPI003452DE51